MSDELNELLDAAKAVLDGFDAGLFCRSAADDGSSGWAIKLFRPLRGLAILQLAVDKRAALTPIPGRDDAGRG
jgi:hypothetical protein